MKKFIKTTLISIVILTISIVCLIPIFKDINYGLDLKGGFEILYQVKPLDGEKLDSDALTATYKTIQNRVNVLGVSEPEIYIEGTDRIRVRLAGIKNEDEAREILTVAANITFRDIEDNLLMNSDVISKAKISQDEVGNPAIALQVDDKDKFYEVTSTVSKSDNPYIVIWLDYDETVDSYEKESTSCGNTELSNCLSAAGVSQGFSSDVIITGKFTEDEVKTLVELINSGTMSTKLVEISSKTVDASLGINTLNNTLIAGIIGIAVITIFMTIIYRFSGLFAGISLITYSFIVFGLFWLIGGILTLPGIAAIVLGVGMAIDANVLLFERLKEELLLGKSLSNAYNQASKRSFTAIFDSNITTLIVALILFFFGESSVKGFATMLIITLVATIIVMLVINRKLLKSFVESGLFDNKVNWFTKINTKNIVDKTTGKKHESFRKLDFIKHAKSYFVLPVLILIIGCISLVINGFNLAVDFTGGTNITTSSDKELTYKLLSSEMETLGYTITDAGEIDEKQSYVKIEEVLTTDETDKVNEVLEEKYEAVTQVDVVSNLVSKELIKSAVIALIIALVCIVIYISLRFEWKFAISCIVALLNDITVIFAMFSLFKFKISSIFIAAILTIIGYSINNTIVVFDRIRENLSQTDNKKRKTLKELIDVVNSSLRETLLRNIYTTITTLIPVVCLLIIGSFEILYFNIAIVIGLIAGAYSSLLMAASLWLFLNRKNKNIKKQSKTKAKELIVPGIND